MSNNKTLLETVTELRSINDRVKFLEEQVRLDVTLKDKIQPLIDQSKIKIEQLNATILTCEIDGDQVKEENSTMKEESWVATTWARHVQDLPKLDAACNDSFNVFIGRAEIFFRAYIRDRPSREKPFLSAVYSSFDLNIERSLGLEFLNCKTWLAGKALLEKSFALKSHYLLKLSEVFDVEYDRDKPLAHYTSNVLQKMNEAKQATLTSYKHDRNTDATVDDVFDIISTMLLYLNLRKEDPEIFNAILPSLSKVYDINELTRLAQSTRQNRVDNATISQHFNRNKKKKKGKRSNDDSKGQAGEKQPETKMINKTKNVEDFEPFDVHIYTVKKKRPGKAYFASATFTADSNSFDAVLEVDSGAESSCLSAAFVPDKFLQMLKPCNFKVTGFSPNIPAEQPLGTLPCHLSFNGGPSFSLNLTVMPGSKYPNLLGRDILENEMTEAFTIDNTNRSLSFNFNKDFTKTETQLVKLDGVKRTKVKKYLATKTTLNKGNNQPSTSDTPPQAQKLDAPAINVAKCPIQLVKQKLNISLPADADKGQQLKVAELIWEFCDVFGCEGKKLGEFPTEIEIPTDGTSRNISQHPIPQAFHQKVTDEIARMLEEGVIEEIQDQKGFNSPVLPVLKKSGDLRLCINFKHSLNKCLSDKSDPYHLPSMEDTIADIGKGNKFYATCDLRSGYWQCPIKKSDRYKTSFQWGRKSYAFCRLPFGYRCSGNIFSRVVNQILDSSPCRNQMLSYIDDIVCFGKTFSCYISTLRNFFIALRKFNAKLKSDKCSFLQTQAHFLGRIIDEHGIKPDPAQVSAIRQMKPPRSQKELASLCGSLNWIRGFLETNMGEAISSGCFSSRMKPINDVRNSANETNVFQWTKEADSALKEIQHRLSETPVISFPNFRETFHLYCDASLFAAGGVLLQEYDNRVHLVSAISHTFNKAERKWNTSEKEMYAIVWCCERLEKLLKGRFFQIHTDHRSLIFLHKKKFKNSKISRWQSRLEEFDFHIIYIKGSENQFADFMSRRPGEDNKSLGYDSEFPAGREYKIDDNSPVRVFVPFWNENQFPKKITLSEVKIHKVNVKAVTTPSEIPMVSANFNNILEYQMEDSALNAIITFLETGKDRPDVKSLVKNSDHRFTSLLKMEKALFLDHVTGCLMVQFKSGARAVVPEAVKSHFLYLAHDLSGHLGEPRTLERLEDVWWPSLESDVSNYVHSCVPCLRRKGSAGTRSKPPLGILRRGKSVGESLQIDYACMPLAAGFKYYLVVVDTFSRYTWCIPCRSDTAICAAKALIYKVFLPMDFLPKALHSDRGTHFCSSVLDEMCKINNIKHTISTAFHPQSNAFAERANRTIKNSLFCMVNSTSGRNWVDCVPHVMRALNSVKNKSTKVSPREVWFGRKSTFTISNGAEMTAENPKVFGLNVGALAKSVEAVVLTSMEAADRAMELRQKNEPKPKAIPAGAAVYVKRENLTDAKSKKERFVGPLRAVTSNDFVVMVEDKKGQKDFVHREHVVHAAERNQDLRWIDFFESEYIFPHLTEIVKSKVPQNTPTSTSKSEEKSGSNTHGGRNSSVVASTPMVSSSKLPRSSLSPIRDVSRKLDTENLGNTTSTSVLDSSGSSAASPERWYSGGTMFETAEDISATDTVISNVVAPDNNHMSVDSSTKSSIEGSTTDKTKKRTRPKSSPDRDYSVGQSNITLSEVGASHLPKHAKRRQTRQVEPFNIAKTSGQSYE